jgi:hypothetical protein
MVLRRAKAFAAEVFRSAYRDFGAVPAAADFNIDDVIDLWETRHRVIRALEPALNRRSAATGPTRRHAIMPEEESAGSVAGGNRPERVQKVSQIAAGTSEVLRLLIYYRRGRRMRDDLKVPQRRVDPDLKVPLPVGKRLPQIFAGGEKDVLSMLAENYRVNPGLRMTLGDIREWIAIDEAYRVKHLESLEKSGTVGLYRSRKGNSLARITLVGCRRPIHSSTIAGSRVGSIPMMSFRPCQ